MIQNKLVLYCHSKEQAYLWEVCKNRRCTTSSCAFKKIAKNYGENLWSPKPFRVASIDDVKDYLEELSKPMPLIRTPVRTDDDSHHMPTQPVFKKDTTPKEVKPSAKSYSSVGDVLREAIKDAISESM